MFAGLRRAVGARRRRVTVRLKSVPKSENKTYDHFSPIKGQTSALYEFISSNVLFPFEAPLVALGLSDSFGGYRGRSEATPRRMFCMPLRDAFCSHGLFVAEPTRLLHQSFGVHLNPKSTGIAHNIHWSANKTLFLQQLKRFPPKTPPSRIRTHTTYLQSVFILPKCNSDFSVSKLEVDGIIDYGFSMCTHG